MEIAHRFDRTIIKAAIFEVGFRSRLAYRYSSEFNGMRQEITQRAKDLRKSSMFFDWSKEFNQRIKIGGSSMVEPPRIADSLKNSIQDQ